MTGTSIWSVDYEGPESWPQSIQDKVNAFIDMDIASKYRVEVKEIYRNKKPINAAIFLKWHEAERCSLVFNEEELKIIQAEAERKD